MQVYHCAFYSLRMNWNILHHCYKVDHLTVKLVKGTIFDVLSSYLSYFCDPTKQ